MFAAATVPYLVPMARKIILDTDPGIDDAVAITMALFDPRVEVVAITATAGTVDAPTATHNAAAILAALDPPKYPRLGTAAPPQHAPVFDDGDLHGSDGLAETRLPASPRQHRTPSIKVISDVAVQYPGQITLVCLGPLTNLAELCKFDPAAIEAIDRVVISGGSITAPGNATAVAERNMYFDPPAADLVFDTPLTKSVVPLDVTDEATFGVDLIESLPDKYTRAGSLLHKILPYAFRKTRQKLGRETLPMCDPVTLGAAVQPELFTWQPASARVETRGDLTAGMTVFDRRLRSDWQENCEVATSADVEAIHTQITRCLKYAGQVT